MVLAMRHGVLPKTLHLDEPTPHVDWSAGAVELLKESQPWTPNGHRRRAGVSSFGIGGTNAHVVLEEAPEAAGTEEQPNPSPAPITFTTPPLLVSAKSPEALAAQAERLAAHLQEHPDLDLRDAAFTLAAGRAQLEHRAAVVGEEREELLAGLQALAEGAPAPGVAQGRAKGTRKTALLLTGQGAQRPGMGAELYETSPVFAAALDQICAELDPRLERSLKELLFAEEGSPEAALLDQTQFTQPALFALEVALYRLVESLGIKPDYLIGHSIGELAAAHLAGVLSLEDACALVAARGALMGALPAGGAMVAIEATEEDLGELPEGLSLAAVNGPSSIVISGEEDAVQALQERFEAEGRRTRRLAVSHAFHSALMEPMLADFEELAAGLIFNPPQIPIASNLTGEPLSDEQATDPAYWARQVREPVRFARGIEFLAEQGVTAFFELGPDGVLSAMAQGCLDPEAETIVAPLLRKGRPEAESLLGALVTAHCHGVAVDWPELLPGAEHVELPTYAFQRQRYWLEPRQGAGDLTAAGQSDAGHPLLGAAAELPGGGLLLTGRLSLQSHPWLADHAVAGTPLLPGAAFLELALAATERVGAAGVEELVLQAPLILPEQGAVQLQVSVSEADEDDRREIAVHSRPEEEDAEWTRHAAGTLAAEPPEAADVDLTQWPPQGAEPIETIDLYERTAERGFDYGPAFQGLQRAWRKGEEIFAEVELAEEQREQAGQFAMHPALLDAALHAGFLAVEEDGEARLPFSFGPARLRAGGASSLRVKLAPTGEGAVAIAAADQTGEPVISISSLATRPVDPAQLRAAGAGQRDSLFELQWSPAAAREGDFTPFAVLGDLDLPGLEERFADLEAATKAEEIPETIICSPGVDGEADPVTAAHQATADTLALLQSFLTAEPLAESRLAILTRSAVAASPEEAPDPAAAAIWGLARSAQSEHPGRFVLVDVDENPASLEAMSGALAIAEEPQLAIRAGQMSVPRLARAELDPEAAFSIDPERTVLVTGGLGALGSLFARHLAESYGAKHLLLVSRRGPEAEGAAELKAELEELGASVTIAACDVADRGQLESLIEQIPTKHPLGAVIHAAGAIDDGLLSDLSAERIDAVMAPKADAAWALHELTTEAELSHFVLFSSAAATLGSPGQANYAAANAFMDALAQRRRVEGSPATALAWGLWDLEDGMGAGLGEVERARLRRGGFVPLSPEDGRRLFDSAPGSRHGLLVVAPVDLSSIRLRAGSSASWKLFAGLTRTSSRRAAEGASISERLALASESKRDSIVEGVVLREVAAVLGYVLSRRLDPERSFSDLGFDSLGAVELQNRLSELLGVRLAPTVIFDYPTPAELCEHVKGEVDPVPPSFADGDPQDSEIRDALLSIPTEHLRRAGLLDPILELSRSGDGHVGGLSDGDEDGSIDALDLGGLVERALGSPEVDGGDS
jgi:acyl transferase domain-containing protein/NAD(P)-dependent dehydrogenase (short-subunit alcohol dehydrogenase family)/acyl carrier protein